MNRPVVAGVLLGLGIVTSGTLALETLVLSTSVPIGSLPQSDRPSTRLASPTETATRRQEFGELAATGASGPDPRELQAPPLFDPVEEAVAGDDAGDDEGGKSPARRTDSERLSTEAARDIQQRLLEAARSPRTTSATDVADVLAELRQEMGDRDVGGHRLSQLEEITRTAARAQDLAEEITGLAADPTPENRRRLGELIENAQRLSAELSEQMRLPEDLEQVNPEAIGQAPQEPLLQTPGPADSP